MAKNPAPITQRVPQASQWEVVLVAITIIAVAAILVAILSRASSDPAGVTAHDLRMAYIKCTAADSEWEVRLACTQAIYGGVAP